MHDIKTSRLLLHLRAPPCCLQSHILDVEKIRLTCATRMKNVRTSWYSWLSLPRKCGGCKMQANYSALTLSRNTSTMRENSISQDKNLCLLDQKHICHCSDMQCYKLDVRTKICKICRRRWYLSRLSPHRHLCSKQATTEHKDESFAKRTGNPFEIGFSNWGKAKDSSLFSSWKNCTLSTHKICWN